MASLATRKLDEGFEKQSSTSQGALGGKVQPVLKRMKGTIFTGGKLSDVAYLFTHHSPVRQHNVACSPEPCG